MGLLALEGLVSAQREWRIETRSKPPPLRSLALSRKVPALFVTLVRVNTPMLSSKLLNLKYLSTALKGVTFSPSYDYFSLVSFLDASPSLETFNLNVSLICMEHVSVFGDPSELRQMPEHKHDKLRHVKISGFPSAKSLVELTCYILGSATSLEWLTLELDIKEGLGWPECSVKYSSVNKSGKCSGSP